MASAKQVLWGVGSQFRSMWMIFSHAWRKRDTLQYPEEKVYLPPRYRGRIVLTRDPDGEERCVACKKQKGKMDVGMQISFASIFHAVFFVACVKKPARPMLYS